MGGMEPFLINVLYFAIEYYNRKRFAKKQAKTFPRWEWYVPTLGTRRSHYGNICFTQGWPKSPNKKAFIPLSLYGRRCL